MGSNVVQMMARALALALSVGCISVYAWAQGGIYADGFELGHTCRWSLEEPTADCSGAEITVTLPGEVPLILVRIPGGTFWMGSPIDERSRLDQEDLHQVTLTQDFYIGKYEVTQAQWQAVMGTLPDLTCFGGPHGVGSDYPVYCVSWEAVTGFISQLNAHLVSTSQPASLRLPTEAEWERATRAGNQQRFSHGDVLDCVDIGDCEEPCTTHDQYMWWCGNDNPHGSKPVGSKLPNGFGMFDVHGNMYEWTQDWYQDHLGTSPVVNPTGPGSGSARVLRGGGWPNDATFGRSANRFSTTPNDYDYYIGFRLAKTAP